jgi:CBS domain-containing protein
MSKNMTKSIFVVERNNTLSGIIKAAEINRVLMLEGNDFLIADDVAVPFKEYSFLDEPLNEAAKLMAAHHLTEIPVVDSFNTSKVVGVLKSENIFRLYASHVSKRGEILDHQAHNEVIPSDMITVVFTVTPRSLVVGKLIKELNLPEGVHFNLVKRNDKFSVPHGNMLMMIKDQVTVIVMPQQQEALRIWLRKNKLKDF